MGNNKRLDCLSTETKIKRLTYCFGKSGIVFLQLEHILSTVKCLIDKREKYTIILSE